MRRAIEAHLRSEQVSRVIYGAIIGLALVVALEHQPPAPGVMVGTLLATAVAVGLAELYSEVVGTEARTHRRVGPAGIVRRSTTSARSRSGSRFRVASSCSRRPARSRTRPRSPWPNGPALG